MPTTANTINYYVAADGTLRDGQQGAVAQTPRLNYGTEYSVTLTFPASTIAEGDQLQVALNRTRTFFSSASATGDAPVAAVAKHEVTAEEADAQAVTLTLSTNTRAMIDQVNGIDHPVRSFFGVHVLRGQSFVTLAVADALMMSLESGPDAISPSLPVVDYPTREEAEQIKQDTITAQGKAEEAQGKAEEAQGKAEEAQGKAEEAQGKAEEAQGKAEEAQGKAEEAQGKAEEAQGKAEEAQGKAETAEDNAQIWAEGTDQQVEELGGEHSAKVWAQEAAAVLSSKRDILQTLVTSSATSLEVEAGKSYNWTVSAASTISMKAADKVASKETRIDIYIDLQDGGSVTGDGVAVADAVLQSGWYKLIWDGTGATLYSTKAGGAASVITIPAATTSYTLQDNKHYQQVPSAVPTYTLPTATMDGLVHEITVLVDFLHVTSCSFVDAGGVPVTLQSSISPQIGEAYIFRCYWYGKWRVVPLKIRNAATVSSATGVVEVSDAVAGDALALKMTAPRSVVVNQLIQNGDFANGTTGWGTNSYRSSISVVDGVMNVTITDVGSSVTLNQQLLSVIAGHKYITKLIFEPPKNSSGYIRLNLTGAAAWQQAVSGTANTKNTVVALFNGVECNSFVFYPISFNFASFENGDVFKVYEWQLVDLTQYFNGDQTLIDSITSWDDLVAYDPRFASYVEYNTGEVVGIQPTVKVTGKNFLDVVNCKKYVSSAPYTNDVYTNGTITSTFRLATQASTYIYTILELGLASRYIGKTLTVSFVKKVNNVVNTSYTGCGFVVYDDGYKNVSMITSPSNTVTAQITDQYKNKKLGLRLYYVAGEVRNIGDVVEYSNIQLELGSTATAYEPYHDGGTAQAPAPLFAVGNAADEFEAVAGVTTRKMASVDMGTLRFSAYREPASGTPYGYCTANVAGKALGGLNVMCANYISNAVSAAADKHLYSTTANTTIVIVDSSFIGKTGAEIATALSGQTLYYELATPTTSQSTPTQISLQAGSNVAMQTDGGRTLAGLALTYENLPSES